LVVRNFFTLLNQLVEILENVTEGTHPISKLFLKISMVQKPEISEVLRGVEFLVRFDRHNHVNEAGPGQAVLHKKVHYVH